MSLFPAYIGTDTCVKQATQNHTDTCVKQATQGHTETRWSSFSNYLFLNNKRQRGGCEWQEQHQAAGMHCSYSCIVKWYGNERHKIALCVCVYLCVALGPAVSSGWWRRAAPEGHSSRLHPDWPTDALHGSLREQHTQKDMRRTDLRSVHSRKLHMKGNYFTYWDHPKTR